MTQANHVEKTEASEPQINCDELIKNHPNPTLMKAGLSNLKRGELLTPEYINIIKGYVNPSLISSALVTLHKNKLLENPLYLNAVKKHDYPILISVALEYLKKADLLTDDNFQKLTTHQNISSLLTAMSCFEIKCLLSQSYFDLVLKHKNLQLLSKALS